MPSTSIPSPSCSIFPRCPYHDPSDNPSPRLLEYDYSSHAFHFIPIYSNASDSASLLVSISLTPHLESSLYHLHTLTIPIAPSANARRPTHLSPLCFPALVPFCYRTTLVFVQVSPFTIPLIPQWPTSGPVAGARTSISSPTPRSDAPHVHTSSAPTVPSADPLLRLLLQSPMSLPHLGLYHLIPCPLIATPHPQPATLNQTILTPLIPAMACRLFRTFVWYPVARVWLAGGYATVVGTP